MAAVNPGIFYSLVKDVLGWIRRRRHMLSPEERLARREKWKERCREEIWNTEEKELRQDVIIRDVRRQDRYPDSEDSKGISAWFRVGLVGQYHRGILLALGIQTIVVEESEGPYGEWRLTGPTEDTTDAVRAYLIGYVRYDDIEMVDWHGDEYYNFPHIFCHFSHRGEPYEKLVYCERKSVLPKHHFFTEIAEYNQVSLTSQKFGTSK